VRLAIDDDLGLSDTEFVAWWNGDEECLKQAVASRAPSIEDLSLVLVDASLVVLQAVGYGVVGNYVYDLIRSRFRSRGQEILFEEIRRPDGEVITRIKMTSDG
jgi:hypothetical protein